MQKISREHAIQQAGIDAVTRVEHENCAPTGRVGYNGAAQGNDLIEWVATVPVTVDGTSCHLSAYYYTTQDEVDAAGDDLSNIDWFVDGYVII